MMLRSVPNKCSYNVHRSGDSVGNRVGYLVLIDLFDRFWLKITVVEEEEWQVYIYMVY